MTKKKSVRRHATHGRIIAQASRLLRGQGPEGTSVADVMAAAGLTVGGFYRHFPTKEALLAEALPAAFEDFGNQVMAYVMSQPPGDLSTTFQRFYLSEKHQDDRANGCPMAALGSDVARASPALKAVFGAGLTKVINALAKVFEAGGPDPSAQATQQIAMLVGALILARASDPVTGNAVISAIRAASDLEMPR